jgi:hypothetical protein
MKKSGLTAVILLTVLSLFLITGCVKDEKEELTETQGQLQSVTTSLTPVVKAGDIISFGSYEQDNNTANGTEPVDWKVLALENGKTLLISDKILDCKEYNEDFEEVTWETCTLRAWLNSNFLNSTFSADEKAKITETNVANSENTNTTAPGGHDTKDIIFLISYNEIKKYFLNIDFRITTGTDYAKSKGLKVSDKSDSLGNSTWWLRSPGYNPSAAWTVGSDGNYLRGCSYNVNSAIVGVRPAMWISV